MVVVVAGRELVQEQELELEQVVVAWTPPRLVHQQLVMCLQVLLVCLQGRRLVVEELELLHWVCLAMEGL